MSAFVAFWNVLAMMAPWLLGGFLLAGIISVLMPREWVVRAMGRSRGWRGVLNAVLIGVPLPICSCGVLPLTAGLRKAGAGRGAVAGFLISTPQTGVDSVLATYSLLGLLFAVVRPLAAFLTGIVGGVVVDWMTMADEKPAAESCCCHCHEKRESAHACCCADEEAAVQGNVVVRVLRTAYGELLGEMVWPLVLGLVIAALLTAFVPENFFATAFGGNDWLAMPVMIVVGFPMYVCSTASIPIAVSLILKGLSPGAAFVFLMVGPAINAASLATVSTLIGRRAAVAYALVIALGALICGIIINLLPFELLPHVASCCAGEHVTAVEHVAALALVLLILHHLLPNDRKKGCCCGG
ncbi:MAG: SO_0444 family Cu/Zn efflux transporter [Kiritimatiellae bacterium]|nr:SO_0444 family Cu/Zn efflux transporter [Kiritimatiellia bacterium]